MNPFDLRGLEFLLLYIILFVVVLVLAAGVRLLMRKPDDEPPPEALDLAPYEVVYLRGGEDLTVNAAIARLVHEDVLAVDAGEHKLKRREGGAAPTTSKLEQAIYSAAKGDSGATVADVRSAAGTHVMPIQGRLEDLGLLVDRNKALMAQVVPLMLLLLVPLFGVIKIFVGLARGRPVLFLVLLCIGSVVVAFMAFARPLHRSRRGDRALERLKQDNAALETQASHRTKGLSGDDLVLAMGLFGMDILSGGPLAALPEALKRPVTSSSGGSVSGSTFWFLSGCGIGSGGGSSCGGGGCGGGCGGGGCGGCGGG